ncbi:hypothetical protein ADUPG1_011520, partial [Aduncisulcus paluster]
NPICGMDSAGIEEFSSHFTNISSFAFDDTYCSCTPDSFSYSNNIVCSNLWTDGIWSPACYASSYRNVEVQFTTEIVDGDSPCISIDPYLQSDIYDLCSGLKEENKLCIGIGTDLVIDDLEIVCSEGWYGDNCDSECPVDRYGTICGSGNNSGCDYSTHTCVCSDGYTGDLCDVKKDIVLMSLDSFENELVKAVCDGMNTNGDMICSDTTVLNAITSNDLTSLTAIEIPISVTSLSGLELAQNLEILTIKAGNTSISDLSPLSSLSSLYSLSIIDSTNMSYTMLKTLVDAVDSDRTEFESNTTDWDSSNEYCVGLCSLRKLEISGSEVFGRGSTYVSTNGVHVLDASASSASFSESISLLNQFAVCSGDCLVDGMNKSPLGTKLTHLDLSYNSISDPSLISSLPAFENLSHISLDNNEVSDISFLSTIVDSIDRLSYMNVSKNLLDCGDSDECFILLDDISTKDMKDDGTTVVFGTQDTTSTCGS